LARRYCYVERRERRSAVPPLNRAYSRKIQIQSKLVGKQHLQHTELKTAMINKQHWAKHALTRMPLIPEISQSAHAAQCGFDVSVALSSKRSLLHS
jgi:hypothetical protein